MHEIKGIMIIKVSPFSYIDICNTDWFWFNRCSQIFGARPIRRWLEKRVVTELSRMLIREEIDENSTVYIDAAPGKKALSYRVEKNGGMVNASTGRKSDILIEIPDTVGVGDGAAQVVKKMKIEADDVDEDMED